MPNIKRSVNAVTSCTKQRKIADEYVRLCGYKNGEHGNKLVQNGPALSLKEIAAQLGTSEGSLKRSLRIERNLIEGYIGVDIVISI